MVSDEGQEGGRDLKVDSNILITIFKEFEALTIFETTIKPVDGGWEFYTMDPSRTSIVKAYIKPEAFEGGSTLENDVEVSVPFMLDVLQKDKTCDISFDDSYITVKYDRSKRTKRISVPLEDGPRPIPKLEGLSTTIVMSDDLIDIAKQSCFSNIITETGGITVRMTETGLTFESKSEVESAEMSVEGTTVLEDGEQSAAFAIKLLPPILKLLPKGLMITLSMKTDFPIHVSINEDTYSMDAYVAPLIPTE